MKPKFELYANANRVTPIFTQHLISLTVTDEIGETSDRLSITLDNSNIAIPSQGAELELHLGYSDSPLTRIGIFVVDEVTLSGPPDIMMITANGAPFKGSSRFKELQTRKTRTWPKDLSLADVVTTIATEHGLEPVVDQELLSIAIANAIFQTEESDIHLLSRLSKTYGATLKPTFGKLLFIKTQKDIGTQGRPVAAFTIDQTQVSSWNLSIKNRSRYQSVIAKTYNKETAEEQEIRVGEGEPIFKIRQPFSSRDEALRNAREKLIEFNRGTRELSFSMIGNPRVIAGLNLELGLGWNPAVKLEGIHWKIKRVSHKLTIPNGLTTSIVAEG